MWRVAACVIVVVLVLLVVNGTSAVEEPPRSPPPTPGVENILVILLSEVSSDVFSDASTLVNLFEAAAFPQQLRVVVWETVQDGKALGSSLIQAYAKRLRYGESGKSYANQIQVHRCTWDDAPSPSEQVRRLVSAYHEGEPYVLTMFYPSELVRHWDLQLLQSWRSLHDPVSVLTFPLTREPSFTHCASIDPMFQLPRCGLKYLGRKRGKESTYAAALWCTHLSFSRSRFWLDMPSIYTALPLCCEILITAYALQRNAKLYGATSRIVTSRSTVVQYQQKSLKRWQRRLKRDDATYETAQEDFKRTHALLREDHYLQRHLGIQWKGEEEVELSGRSILGVVREHDSHEILVKYGSFALFSRARQSF